MLIGYQAGRNINSSNKLYISSGGISTPLIYGEFDTRRTAINTINANGQTFYVNGSAGGTGAWNATSDARLKTNVKPLEGALQKVMQLNGVTFNWKDETNHRPGENIGFIAQDLLKVFL